MAEGEVKDKGKFCKIDKEDRLSQCNTDCQRASGIQRHKDACRFGCKFWPDGQFFLYLLSFSIICFRVVLPHIAPFPNSSLDINTFCYFNSMRCIFML